MIYRKVEKAGSCKMELWNKDKGLHHCGNEAIVKMGQNYVCRCHLPHVLGADMKAEFYDSNNKAIKSTGDFFDYLDGKKIKKKQK